MKVILSRKGYDSSYGGGFSPIMPNGDLISIPIPANEKEIGIPYEQIYYKKKSYIELMAELKISIPKNRSAHFDPDIIKSATKRSKGWKGAFGQQGAAQSHLENQNVEIGDVFLFFGSFKRTFKREKISFERDYERHIIFGYLKVGKILKSEDDFENYKFQNHPHILNRKVYKERNAIYLATADSDYGGFKFREELVLTKNGFSKSIWELPIFFHPKNGTSFSRHSEKDFEIRDQKVMLNSRGIGQDFVIYGNEHIKSWTNSIIGNSKII